jgi:cell division protein FtsL
MEIIPKQKRKLPSLENIFLYISFLIFILMVFFFLFLFFQETLMKGKVSQLQEKLLSLKTPENEKTEKELLKYQDKISQFSKILDNHFFFSKIFPYLEERIHKQIYFNSMDLDFENSTIFISGQSPSFAILFQQMEVFQNDQFLKPELKELNLAEEGKVNFKIEIHFDKNILK